MAIGITINDGEGRYGPKGKDYYATVDNRTHVSLSKEDADAISVHMDAPFAVVTYGAWEAYIKAAEVVVG